MQDKQAEARDLRRTGLSYREIGRRLGVTHPTVMRWCDDDFRKEWNERKLGRYSNEQYAEWHRASYSRARNTAKVASRRAAEIQARPPWLTRRQKADIDEMYRQADRMTQETGIQHSVDHIEPLRGVDRCGLHVSWNLQVITLSENSRKSNRTLVQ